MALATNGHRHHSATNNNNHHSSFRHSSTLTNAALTNQLTALRQASTEHGHLLTQKLASSDSGQALLHIGTQLSSLPTDLHAAMSLVHPLVVACEQVEQHHVELLQKEIQTKEQSIHRLQHTSRKARAVADICQQLQALEHEQQQDHNTIASVDHWERAAHSVRYLVDQFQQASSSQQHDHESVEADYGNCLLQLGSRIRACERHVIDQVSSLLETSLLQTSQQDDACASCIRALLLLEQHSTMERILRTTLLVPSLQTTLTMGAIDQGGPRGHCHGLQQALHQWVQNVLIDEYHLDRLVREFPYAMTRAIWKPLETAVVSSFHMLLFAPGMPDILQRNYVIWQLFLKEELIDTLGLQAPLVYRLCGQTLDKKWNLAIYYQLRFGEACTVLNTVITTTQHQGWNNAADSEGVFELTLFTELHHLLCGFWDAHVIVKPLTHRFVRGAVQLIGRVADFVAQGMEGTLLFGGETAAAVEDTAKEDNGQTQEEQETMPSPAAPAVPPYNWGERSEQVAAVAWELSLLETWLRQGYVDLICAAVGGGDIAELRTLVSEVIADTCDQLLVPLIDKAWNTHITKLLTDQCLPPLVAVKGVAATYRMTNRPPPTQASPFVATILRPVSTFNGEFLNKIPSRIGPARWKHAVAVTVSDKYATAVADLLSTVQRTEEALKNRRGKRQVTNRGMSDGEKVKLQLYLDAQAFITKGIQGELGLEPSSLVGVSKLIELTAPGKALMVQDTT